MLSTESARKMTLAELLGSSLSLPKELAEIGFCGLSDDSRHVLRGQAYLALPGKSGRHGWQFAQHAVDAGACLVIADRQPSEAIRAKFAASGVKYACLADLNRLLPKVLARVYPLVPGQLKIIAVTGTNGKSTVVDLLRQLLPDCASMGSNGVRFRDSHSALSLTTATITVHFQQLHRLQSLGARFVALEASSIGIEQGRLDTVPIDIAVLTNISRDHLDYHGDMSSYAQAKFSLFEHRHLQAAVINAADELGHQLASRLQTSPAFQYRVSDDDAQASDSDFSAFGLQFDEDGVRFSLNDSRAGTTRQCHSALLCVHNVENLLAALSVAFCLNQQPSQLLARLPMLQPCPGRTQSYRMNDDRLVMIDYAHTPDALDRLLDGLRSHGFARISVVFGCGGGRDRGKRAAMAAAVARHACRIIVTNDNPRDEDPKAIFDDILSGFSDSVEVELIADRSQAIAAALTSENQDLVVIAGRGNESRQVFADRSIELVDLEVVKKLDGTASAEHSFRSGQAGESRT